MKIETIEDLIAHQKAFNERLYLVASENSPSINARTAFLTDVLNRYYFPLDEYKAWAFPGNEFLESIQIRCRRLLQELTGAKYVNIRPISGVNCMTVALAALTKIGDTIFTFAPVNGGHHITKFIAERLGLKVAYIPYDQSKFSIDAVYLAKVVSEINTSLIYLDQAHILFPHPLEEMRRCIPETTKIYYDGSHVMGLIFGNNFQNPLKEGATFLGGSTHKTIPGPHKGFIATNDEEGHERIERCSKNFVSHDHCADIAALTIVLEEMKDRWPSYARQVVKNAQYLARALEERGFKIAANDLGHTNSHQMWIDISPYMDAFDAVRTLARCNIILNSIRAPSIPDRLALRIGVQEITYLGVKEDIMDFIADVFEEIFIEKAYSEIDIRRKVADIKKGLVPSLDKEYFERIYDLLGL